MLRENEYIWRILYSSKDKQKAREPGHMRTRMASRHDPGHLSDPPGQDSVSAATGLLTPRGTHNQLGEVPHRKDSAATIKNV